MAGIRRGKCGCMRSRFVCIWLVCAGLVCAGQVCVRAEDGRGSCEHVFQTEIRDATDLEPGSITYTCSRCGYSYRDEIAPYGHRYVLRERQDGAAVYQCRRCGAIYTVLMPPRAGEPEPVDAEHAGSEITDTGWMDGGGADPPDAATAESGDIERELSDTGRHTSAAPHRTEEPPAGWETAGINAGDIMITGLELALLAALLPEIITCHRLISWNRKRLAEYRRHHRGWKETG